MKYNSIKDPAIASLDDRLWFGIYRGKKISEVPEAYVGWCIEKGIFTLGEKDHWFTESCQLDRAETEALFDFRHGDWGANS